MAKHSRTIRIGIIGSDSSHTLAFIKEFQKYPTCAVMWVDINNRSNLSFSKTRSEKIIETLKEMNIPLVTKLEDREVVDAYCILNLDADTHVSIYEEISHENKPVFIDKPIFYQLEDFEKINDLVLSSSALRYTDFIKRACLDNEGSMKDIYIEGPLSFVEGIDGYFWYGIHLVEILHTLCDDEALIRSFKKDVGYEEIRGKCKTSEFTIKGITIGDPGFLVKINGKQYSINDDEKSIYTNLIQEIVNFFETKEVKTNGRRVIETVLKINEMREDNA